MSPAEAKKRGANATDNNGTDSEAHASTHQRSHGHERLRGALVVAGVALLTVKVGIPLLKAVGECSAGARTMRMRRWMHISSAFSLVPVGAMHMQRSWVAWQAVQ